jgi:large subunit ribosomal protein L32e
MSKKFKRQESVRHLKLGKRKKKLRSWRKPKGRDSKMRLKRKGYATKVSIGFKSKPTPQPILVHNIKDLASLDKKSIIVLAKVGAKKKIEIMNQAREMNLKITNVGGQK